MFSSRFCFVFLQGSFMSFRNIMASANNNKGKEPLKYDPQDPKLEEEVKSEARERSPQVLPRATLSGIQVVARPPTTRRTTRMST